MKRFYNNPKNAQSKFNYFAWNINKKNLMNIPLRGGIRL